MNKKTFWENNPCIYENISIFLIVFLFVISGITGLSGLIHPWMLFISEIIKSFSLPSFLTSDTILNWCCKGIHNFFNHKILYEKSKNIYNFKNTQYIKCLMPHGYIPFSLFCLNGDTKNTEFNWKHNITVTAQQLYYFPFLSNYAKKCNGIPSLYNKMENALQNKNSLMVYTGGIRETFACSHKKEVIIIKKRKGIFKMAIKTGVSLLPVYTFGITTLYEKSGISVTLPFLFKNDKDSVSWYSGKYYTPFPIRNKLLTVVGNPIPVKKKEIIKDEDIIILRNQYINEIKRLYKKWAPYYDILWKKRKLTIK